MSLQLTPLHAWHAAQNAKMGEFAGFDMPIQYKGILAEHKHTREKASVFDICHMGQFIVKGENATKALSKAITQNFDTLKVGKCRYGFLLTEKGTVIDDLVIYRLEEDAYLLVVNAACAENDFNTIKERIAPVSIEDITVKHGKIDLQGPLARQVLEKVLNKDFKDLGYFSFIQTEYNGNPLLISRTGYTGELGYEIYPVRTDVKAIWDLLINHEDVEAAGLGARDTLRLESGLPLYGHELDTEHSPSEAGFGGMLTSTADFIGKAGALAEAKNILIGLRAEGKRAARNGDLVALASDENKIVGKIMSGSYAPTIDASIAFAYVEAEYADKDIEFLMKAAKTNLVAKRVDMPFYKEGTARIKF